MPRLWDRIIDAHRDAVRGAILDAGFALAAERGLTGVAMSGVARVAGIGRATLARCFADPEAILRAWHERQVALHLARLAALAGGSGTPLERLGAVLSASGHIVRRGGRHGADMGPLLHGGVGPDPAHQALTALVAGLLREGVAEGSIRPDAAPGELAAFCLHCVGAAGALAPEGVARLVAVTLDGVRRS